MGGWNMKTYQQAYLLTALKPEALDGAISCS
jgi:hypothetical protein